MPDPCASAVEGRGVSRACYAKVWKTYCATAFWREQWRHHKHAFQTFTYDRLVQDTLGHRPYRCYPQENTREVCHRLAVWLDWAPTLLHSGFLPEVNAGTSIADEEFVDMADVSRNACPLQNMALRILLQKAPELFANSTRELAVRRGLHRGAPLEALHAALARTPPERMIQERGLFGALRAASEAPFARMLRRRGFDGVDDCARIGFHSRVCNGRNGPDGTSNATLLAAFYRHRDPGLPPAFIARLTEDEDMLMLSGLLADVDRRRNTGMDYSEQLRHAFDMFTSYIAGGNRVEASLPVERRPPQHLLWHFLDKLSLPIIVSVKVDVPRGAAVPHMAEVKMSVLPDRDLVSDHVRRMRDFHCPGFFRRLAVEASEAWSVADGPVRVVEVGGFLGDCLLWMLAWLGPERLRALEVEPVAAATERLKDSLARGGFSKSVDVVTEALGDGSAKNTAAGGGGLAPANPNFAAGAKRGMVLQRRRLQPLDEVLEAWSGLEPGAVVDLVRVKAAGHEALIVAGLERHLEAARIRRLLIETNVLRAPAIKQLFAR
eukprot:CAMPEP_0117592474 /NCGR_PEP_ID=MMETSP0784-20121206/72095_1 /TAXON_ID=39447 /ORGANISM="" /LENGTH=548 /DNA_ID=CAMNT_0005394285 /DNA_START=96 /DNA_END=1738 /DNA_ORIENTATION=+